MSGTTADVMTTKELVIKINKIIKTDQGTEKQKLLFIVSASVNWSNFF
jgi:hypothetical protein